MNSKKLSLVIAALLSALIITHPSALAGSDPISTQQPARTFKSDAFHNWWNGTSALGNWFGLGYPLNDYGLSITGTAKEGFYGITTGGLPNEPKGTWGGEVKMKFLYDFSKVLGIEGLTIESNWRYRQSDGGQNTAATAFSAGTLGNSGMFNPNHMSSGLGVRIMPQFLQWQSEKDKDPRFMFNLGWVNPYEQFLQQPLSKLFENNSFESSKGIGGAAGPGIPVWSNQQNKYVTYASSGVPWSSSYATWGGSLRAKPTATTYVMSGLYLAISGSAGVQNSAYTATDVYPYKNVSSSYLGQIKPAGLPGSYQINTVNAAGVPNKTTSPNGNVVPAQNNHGFNFQGAGAFNPNGYGGLYAQNGLYNVNEIGWTPKFGPAVLEGKYVVGAYIWGNNNTSYTPVTYINGLKAPTAFGQNSVIWGMYFQADQRLYAAPEDAPAGPSVGGKNPVALAPAKTYSKEKGLYMFNEYTFTPAQNNAVPFYFQTGLVYKGLIPHRDKDQMGIALGVGFFSNYLNQYIDSQNQTLKTAYNGSNVTASNTAPNGPVAVNTVSGKKVTTTQYYAYAPHFSSTEVVEAFYQVQLNKWASIKPFAQVIVNPAGNGTVGNELILGASAKLTF